MANSIFVSRACSTRRTLPALTTALLLFLGWRSPVALAVSQAVRDLPASYTPGATFNVTIMVLPDQTASVILRETLPAGWTITSSSPANPTYIAETNTYKWLNFSSGTLPPYNITYTAQVPANAEGTRAITGTFWTEEGLFDIAGDTLIAQGNAVEQPSFSPSPGTYSSAQNVTITCGTAGASIYYTTDGSDPSDTSTLYTAPVAISATTTLKARAYKAGMSRSTAASGTYTIVQTVVTPVFSPAGGVFVGSETVTIACGTAGASIYYTTDGSIPSAGSTLYTGPVVISATTILKARAYKTGMDASSVAEATYTRCPFTPVATTSTWANFYGTAQVLGTNAQAGDCVGAFDPQGVCCGAFKVTTAGYYGYLPVYGDDDTTPGIDEGATAGNTITFKIWQASTGTTRIATTLGPGNPVWYSQSQVQVNLNCQDVWRMPLRTGWNLISFPVANLYYDSANPPDVALLPGLTQVRLQNIGDALASIAGKYDVVQGFDKYGACTYDPDTPMFNTLYYFGPGYGYWIKMFQTGTLSWTTN